MQTTQMDRVLVHGSGDLAPVSEMNVVPFIDIMLVLLIIFMVTAPLMMGGVVVNLPKTTGQPMPRPENPLVVSLDADSRVFVEKEEVAAESRREHFKKLAQESTGGEIYVRGDGEVKYARMMELMAELGAAGFARVTLVTSVTGGDQPRGEAAPGQATREMTANQARADAPGR
jgi:biopolymer transport protein TolR